MPFTRYLKSLRQNLHTGQGGDIQAINEPTKVSFGAPDFLVKRGAAPLGYIEYKDIGATLDDVERTEQLERYLDAFPNVILTGYLEFCWYREGEALLCHTENVGSSSKPYG